MRSPGSSYLITELTWPEVEAQIRRDPRLLVAVGDCDQHGPHLPIGASTIISERLTRDLSEEFGVLRSPPLTLGVNVRTEDPYPGAAGLSEKTLHRVLNELLSDWERQGFQEVFLFTAHSSDEQAEAIASATVRSARIRVIDIVAMDLSQFLDGHRPVQHAGQVETALLLHLAPGLVRTEDTHDFEPEQERPGPLGSHRLPVLPPESRGLLGRPSSATAEMGRAMYEHILGTIRDRLFAPAMADDPRKH